VKVLSEIDQIKVESNGGILWTLWSTFGSNTAENVLSTAQEKLYTVQFVT